MNYWLLILPVISAISGWFIIWLSIRLFLNSNTLYHRFLEQFEKIFPAILSDQLETRMTDPGLLKSSGQVIEKHVDDFLRIRLNKEMPIISQFIGEKTIDSLKKLFMQELESLFPEVMQGFLLQLKNGQSSSVLMKDSMAKLSPDKFRKILSDSLKKDLGRIQGIAAGIGFLFGVLQASVLSLVL